LAYRSTTNAFFRDLPVSSFVVHSSLLIVKNVDLVVARDGFLYVKDPGYRGTFQTVLDVYCCVTSNGYCTSVSDDSWGARHHHTFQSGYFKLCTFGILDSYCCIYSSRQKAVMDTLLSHIDN